MKKIYLFLLIMLSASLLTAQSFQVRIANTDTVVSESDTIHVSGNNENMTSKHFEFENLTDAAIEIQIIREDITLPGDMVANICFGGICYPPSTMESEIETIEANSIYPHTLDVDLLPKDETGNALIKITAKKTNSPEEEIHFYVAYQIEAVGIANPNISALTLYPNPVKKVLYIDNQSKNNANATIQIFDAVGKLVKQVNSKSTGIVDIDLNDVPAGVYMVMLRSNNKIVASRKLLKE